MIICSSTAFSQPKRALHIIIVNRAYEALAKIIVFYKLKNL